MVFVGLLLTVIGSLMLGFGGAAMYKHGFSSVWGISVPYPKWLKTCKILAPFAFVIGMGVMFWGWMVAFSARTDAFFLQVFGPIIGFVAFMFVGIFVTDNKINKKLVAGDNAQVLADLPVMKDIDAESQNCQSFLLYGQGVAFFDQANYCYRTIRFGDYQLGDLLTPKEIWAVCISICQRNDAQFKCKAESYGSVNMSTAAGAVVNLSTGSKINSFRYTRK